MAALPDDVEDFERWIKGAGRLHDDPAATYPERGIFPARALFGEYAGDLLQRTVAPASHVRFRHIQSTVESAHSGTAGYRLECASGERLEADILVLATGHPAPRLPWPLNQLPPQPKLIVNPWLPDSVGTIKPDDKVLIVGTGLTMGDMIATLRRQGHRAPLTAISRRGLTPRPRTGKVEGIEALTFTGIGRVSELLHMIRNEIRKAEAVGRQWTDVFEVVRQQNGAIWTGWSEQEQSRFQRHLRPFWDVHRFQAAPQIHDLVMSELQSGSLILFAAAMTKATILDGKINLSLRRRGQSSVETHSLDAIINCTGASGALIDENAVLTALAEGGTIEPDAFKTGINVDPLSRAKTRKGINKSLFVLGPAIRGCLGEISGALEIAIHAQTVAKSVVACLNERAAMIR